ncbi:hypothetical protein PCIT_b0166 [Pseudoalteromonas citrea]|uniref:Uncharacterized protein n=1 Tax=Pseudoalteromonas citrea TaxID=43655 RepID=A0AAD4AE50_9GAMM|nr:hypothetical protein PCIT_b0166 [Pseudoalteromonas citrea]
MQLGYFTFVTQEKLKPNTINTAAAHSRQNQHPVIYITAY